jgi:hypothetical protein
LPLFCFLALSAPFSCDSVEQDSNADAVAFCVINEVFFRKRINASGEDDTLVIADARATNRTGLARMASVVCFFNHTKSISKRNTKVKSRPHKSGAGETEKLQNYPKQ